MMLDKNKIEQLKKGVDRRLTIDGETKPYQAYYVPLDGLFFNDVNGRISTYIEENDNSKEELNSEESEYSTLDESIYKTFQRDLLRIFHKIKHVAIPTFKSNKSEELQNWDLWGPLLICLVLCM